MEVYIYSTNKSVINRRIIRGDKIVCMEYTNYNSKKYTNKYLLTDLEDKTKINIYNEIVDGRPKVLSTGIYLLDKNEIK